MRIVHTEGWTGLFSPADAHPPFSVHFVNGLADVPLPLFESDQFQVYCRREEAEGVWAVGGPVPALEPGPVRLADVILEGERVRHQSRQPKPVAPAATPKPKSKPAVKK